MQNVVLLLWIRTGGGLARSEVTQRIDVCEKNDDEQNDQQRNDEDGTDDDEDDGSPQRPVGAFAQVELHVAEIRLRGRTFQFLFDLPQLLPDTVGSLVNGIVHLSDQLPEFGDAALRFAGRTAVFEFTHAKSSFLRLSYVAPRPTVKPPGE